MDTCGPCKFRNEDKKATKYCLTCQEPQCKTCAEIHCSSKATRNHLLLKVTDIRNASKTNEDLERFQNCQEHPEKKLEFFCVDHDHFICSTCLLNTHTLDCKTVVDIETAGEQLAANNFIEQLTHDLESVIDHCEEEEKEIQSLIDGSQKERQELRKYMDDFKHNVLKELDTCKKDILDEVDTHVRKQVGELSCQQNLFRETSHTAKENKDILENIISNHSKADIFRCAISVMQQLNTNQSNKETGSINLFAHSVKVSPAFDRLIESLDTERIMKCRTITKTKRLTSNVNFKANKDSFLKSTKQVALKRDSDTSNDYTCSSADAETEDVSETKTGTIPQYKSRKGPAYSSDQKAQVTTSSNKTVKHSSNSCVQPMTVVNVTTADGKQPCITGIIMLHDGRFVLLDSKWQRLIRLNKDLTYKDKVDLAHPPGNMTVLNERFLVVCLPSANRVAFVSALSQFIWIRNIITAYSPNGVHVLDANRLLISMVSASDRKWYMHVLTTQGAFKQNIGKARPIQEAEHISSLKRTPTSPRCYLQCCKVSNTLFCFEINGNEIFRYSVMSPKCVYVDSSRKIYVLDSFGMLHILTSNGTLVRTIAVPKTANGITSNTKTDTLYVTSQCPNAISVFKIPA